MLQSKRSEFSLSIQMTALAGLLALSSGYDLATQSLRPVVRKIEGRKMKTGIECFLYA
jgi:hypothetical protein